MGDSLWHLSVEDVLAILEDIVVEYADTLSGVRDRGGIEFALTYHEEGHFGAAPGSIHEKAYHLMRLLLLTIRSWTRTSAPRSTRWQFSAF